MHVDTDLVHLRAGGTSVVVLLDDARLPRILHWGDDLGDLSGEELAAIARTDGFEVFTHAERVTTAVAAKEAVYVVA